MTLRSMAVAVAELNMDFGDNIGASTKVLVQVMHSR